MWKSCCRNHCPFDLLSSENTSQSLFEFSVSSGCFRGHFFHTPKGTADYSRLPGDNKYTVYCRNCAPGACIPEESAAGTASGALGAYLVKYGSPNPNYMVFRQEDALNRPSEIHVRTESSKSPQINIRVGGQVIPFGKRIISI
ncbi:MAG: hypothetical protein DRP86_00125 [Candidatus Neomarinimicrobiota bacterium]|nr:PhzF family phenazine biosynthesis protein [Candidatus Neomarinimicrobiota bacterium]RKY51796.1 MAG: hypothetical protein DRP86_00125 [Candidatus Neomarinimicrobiota bacterium]